MLLHKKTNGFLWLLTEIWSHFRFYRRNTRCGYSKLHFDWRRSIKLKLIFEPLRQRRPGRNFQDKYILQLTILVRKIVPGDEVGGVQFYSFTSDWPAKGHKMAYRRYFDGSFPTHAHECADSNMVLQVIMTSSLYYMRTTYRNRKIFFPIKTVQILKETVPSSLWGR